MKMLSNLTDSGIIFIGNALHIGEIKLCISVAGCILLSAMTAILLKCSNYESPLNGLIGRAYAKLRVPEYRTAFIGPLYTCTTASNMQVNVTRHFAQAAQM